MCDDDANGDPTCSASSTPIYPWDTYSNAQAYCNSLKATYGLGWDEQAECLDYFAGEECTQENHTCITANYMVKDMGVTWEYQAALGCYPNPVVDAIKVWWQGVICDPDPECADMSVVMTFPYMAPRNG